MARSSEGGGRAQPITGADVEAAAAVPPRLPDADVASASGSFVDRLFRWIDGLPLGGWWIYGLLLIASGAWITVLRWATGVAPIGDVDLGVLTPTVFPPFWLALMHYLDRTAERALAAFSPALGGSDRETAFWRRELTTLPPRPALAAALAGGLFGALLDAGTPPAIYRLFGPDLLTTVLFVGWLPVIGFALWVVVLYHTWHQLRAVRAVQAAARSIDLFRPAPLFAFSRVTALTGLAYLLILYYGLAVNGEFTRAVGPALIMDSILIIPAVACFVVPLLGMHGRLTAIKSTLLAESDARIKAAMEELYRRVDTAKLAGAGDVRDALQGLTAVRELIVRLPTWPWSPQVFGGFITALLLPILIWFITRLLGSALSV